jgi:hypothetical protein
LNENEKARQIYGDSKVLKRCAADKKFAYVVTLARSINALTSAHSLMTNAQGKKTPAAQRDRMNSHFFVSAILYESLRLIERMKPIYGKTEIFQNTLQRILKDKAVKSLEQIHLKAARRDAVFHYLPDRFADAIGKTGMTECVFVYTFGERRDSIHYEFADYIATEMMVGERLDNSVVVTEMMERTLHLVTLFIDNCESFIADQLNAWGFQIRTP